MIKIDLIVLSILVGKYVKILHRYPANLNMEQRKLKKVMLLVAHPDDETLWTGGTILSNPTWQCFIVCLCRKNDAERASRFFKALKVLHADGIMGNMDDGPDQIPLEGNVVEQMILKLIPATVFDLIITHNPSGRIYQAPPT